MSFKSKALAGAMFPAKAPGNGSKTSTGTATKTATRTSTVAHTQGNVTVTGGAGDGNTTVHIRPSAAMSAGKSAMPKDEELAEGDTGAESDADAALPPEVQAQRGFKKTHRGRRSKGKGAKAHQAQGQTHIANAAKAPTPAASLGHLFKAVRSMHAATQASAPPADTDMDQM